MAELTDSFKLDFRGNNLLQTYQYTITFDLPTTIVIVFTISLFFCIFYHILHALFYWLIKIRPYLRDVEEGPHPPPPSAYNTLSDSESDQEHHVAIFEALVHSNMQAWLMVGALMEGVIVVDENRGQMLRASKKLPPLVSYGSHDHGKRCTSDCAICLEEFKVSDECQVFPVCNHIFHSDCIDCWLMNKLTCPTCRTYLLD